MSLEELKKQFVVDEDALKARLEPIVERALRHCRIDKAGQVQILNTKLSTKDQIKLTLAARALGAQLEPQISGEVTIGEIAKFTGLPQNQIRARGNDAIKDKFAESPAPGVFRAISSKIEPFLDGITSVDALRN